MRNTLFAFPFLALSACQQPVETPQPELAGNPLEVLEPDTCGGTGHSNLIGQSADILAAMTFPAPMRIIKPGMIVTQEYSPKRLNIEMDENNIIASVWCG